MAPRHCDIVLLALRNATVRNLSSLLHHRNFRSSAALRSANPNSRHGEVRPIVPARDSDGDCVSRINDSVPSPCESSVEDDHSSIIVHSPHEGQIEFRIPVSSAEHSDFDRNTHAREGRSSSQSSRLPPGPSLSDFIRDGRMSQGSESGEWTGAQRASVGASEEYVMRDRERERREGSLGVSTTSLQSANFIHSAHASSSEGQHSAILTPQARDGIQGGRIYFESYGCQMNVADLELVLSILSAAGYTERVDKPEQSDVILINTCAIRENAENKIWHRLGYFKHLKQRWYRDKQGQPRSPAYDRPPPKVAVLGCMAERLKEKLLDADKMVDVVCGPDAYRDLPRLLSVVGRTSDEGSGST